MVVIDVNNTYSMVHARHGGDAAFVSLTSIDSSAIADLLASSFRLDPAIQYTFRGTDPGRDKHYRRLMEAWAEYSIGEKHVLLGVRSQGELVAVVGLTGLDGRKPTWSICRDLPAILRVIPGVRLWRALTLAMAEMRPSSVPTISAEISMLAVHPSYQGRGLAKELLGRAHNITSEALPSAGVYLYTTHPGSRAFYAKQGYALLAHHRIESVEVFHLFRSSEEGTSGNRGSGSPKSLANSLQGVLPRVMKS